MILTKKFLEQLLPAFAQEVTEEETELIYNGHHFDATLLKNEDNELVIKIKYKEEETKKDQFEKWCSQVDDDIFVEACEKFEELTGKTLESVEEEKSYDTFKAVVREIVKQRINSLSKRYL